MRRGFLYLVAVLDWATRRVLAWRLSNTPGRPDPDLVYFGLLPQLEAA
jgi:hypothetical protein